MTTSPEDVDALFDAPAPPTAVFQRPDDPLGAMPDARREARVKVAWPARVQLPTGRVVDLRVRDLSDSGVGLLTEVSIPANTVLNFAMGVPGLHDASQIVPVAGAIKTSYLVVQRSDLCCGGTWVSLPPASRELLHTWIRRLRR